MVVAFARDAESDLEQYDMWRMAYIHWPSIPWKRSALAFLPSLLAKVSQAWEHISVLEALERYQYPHPSSLLTVIWELLCDLHGRHTMRAAPAW